MESESPKKKKVKLAEPANLFKRESENDHHSKRYKGEKSEVEDIRAKKRKNFVKACEQVSYKAYFDYSTRLQLVYLPSCITENVCKHHDYKTGTNIREMPSYAEECVKIEMKSNMWLEALEVCHMSINTEQYLSANVLKDVVEIMLNAHEDSDADFTIEYLLESCQQILSQSFSCHPPCLVKSLRKCYNDFLMSPMDLKTETFTNRSEFGCDKGIVKYCMNRLEYELSLQSKDEPMIDRYENIPEDMKQSVKGLHWQKEKLEIYELLQRTERIERLMAVLKCIVELLQFDLVIWHSRHTNNQGNHIMRSHKPLMAYILWSHNVLYTGAVTNNCRQMLKLFVYLIHLRYPREHMETMTAWLNVIVQTFYVCESNSNSDYPNTGKYCAAFAKEFYKIISEMPEETILRVLERIQPTFMQHMIGALHLQTILAPKTNHSNTFQLHKEEDVIEIFIDFLEKSRFNMFPDTNRSIKITKIALIKPRQCNILKYLMKKCSIDDNKIDAEEFDECRYLRYDPKVIVKEFEVDLSHVVHIFYIIIVAYLDAYSVQSVQDTLDSLNDRLESGSAEEDECYFPEFCSFSITENFIKKYRTMFEMLKRLTLVLNKMKDDELPECMLIFKDIGLFE